MGRKITFPCIETRRRNLLNLYGCFGSLALAIVGLGSTAALLALNPKLNAVAVNIFDTIGKAFLQK